MTRRAGIGYRPLARPRRTAHRRVDHAQQRRANPRDQRHCSHKSTHVTETVYRHVIVPAIRSGATAMGDIFDDNDEAETA